MKKARGGWPIWRTWALLLVATAVMMGSLAIFTFGLACFAGLFLLWVRGFKGLKGDRLYLVNGMMLFLCILWFLLNVVGEIIPSTFTEVLLFPLAFLFPPLLAHMFYQVAVKSTRLHRVWGVCVFGFYALGIGGSLTAVWKVLGNRLWVLPVDMTSEQAGASMFQLMILMTALFILAGIFSAVLMSSLPAETDLDAAAVRRKRGTQRRVNIALLIALVLMFAVSILVANGFFPEFTVFLSTLSRALPLLFLFVNAYYESRFEFFDVFVKKATLFYITLALLVAGFILLGPLVAELNLPLKLRPWIFALCLVPFVMTLPSIFRLLESWMDRVWLGRRFSTAGAVNFFLEGIHESTTPAELERQAESRLAEIFQAEARVSFTGQLKPERPAFKVMEVVPIPSSGTQLGELSLGPRAQDTPYFATDRSLIKALSDVLGFLFQNVSLQQAKQSQEKREQELILDASRSELKALRAQVNPHFLFNALNAVASLTQTDPDRAEETVEQLAEVFRYTLRRSEEEWVRVIDEIEFLRAYLQVEKARFGERLEVLVEVDSEVEPMLIPTMMIQTLVENSIKHAVNRIKGTARICVSAKMHGEAIEVVVKDNGPGFSESQSLKKGSARGSRYGLKNIRERLQGIFGPAASFAIGRDEEDRWTVACIKLPVAGRNGAEQETANAR